MIYWGQDPEKFARVFHKFGAVLSLAEPRGNGAPQDEENLQGVLISEI
jgi:hypothetical protein